MKMEINLLHDLQLGPGEMKENMCEASSIARPSRSGAFCSIDTDRATDSVCTGDPGDPSIRPIICTRLRIAGLGVRFISTLIAILVMGAVPQTNHQDC